MVSSAPPYSVIRPVFNTRPDFSTTSMGISLHISGRLGPVSSNAGVTGAGMYSARSWSRFKNERYPYRTTCIEKIGKPSGRRRFFGLTAAYWAL